jgi:hypothetical protein
MALAVLAEQRGHRRADAVVRDRRGHAHEVGAGSGGGQLDGVDDPPAADRDERRGLRANRVGGQGEGLLVASVEPGPVHDADVLRLQPGDDRPRHAAGLLASAADVDAPQVEAVVREQRGDFARASLPHLQQARQVDVATLGHR